MAQQESREEEVNPPVDVTDESGDIHMDEVEDALPQSTEQKGDWDQSLPDPSSVPTHTGDIGENELVLFKAQDHSDTWKWYVGMVIELPKEGEVYFSVQPYGSNKLTRTKKKSMAESQFIPIWMDERDDKEVWATRAPKECATYLMQVEPEEIILTGFEMTGLAREKGPTGSSEDPYPRS